MCVLGAGCCYFHRRPCRDMYLRPVVMPLGRDKRTHRRTDLGPVRGFSLAAEQNRTEQHSVPARSWCPESGQTHCTAGPAGCPAVQMWDMLRSLVNGCLFSELLDGWQHPSEAQNHRRIDQAKGHVNKYRHRWHKTREYIITLIWMAPLCCLSGSQLAGMQLGFSLDRVRGSRCLSWFRF